MNQKLHQKICSLLRWGQKYTKTDMVYLAQGGFWLTTKQIASAVFAFLLAVAFANLLPKEIYGTYRYVLSIAGILVALSLPGINTAIIQATAKGKENVFFSALKARILWGLLGGLAGIILSGYYYLAQNITLAVSFLIIAFFVPFFDSLTAYNSLLQGKKLFKLSAKYQILSHFFAFAVVLATLFLTSNIFFILISYFSSWTLVRFFFFKKTTKKTGHNSKEASKVVSFGKHLSLMGLFEIIAAQIDKVLLFFHLGATELAIYIFATVIPDQIKGITKNIRLLALPKFSQRSTKELQRNLFKRILRLSLLLIAIVAFYIFIAPIIFKIFFPLYANSIAYSQVYAISLVAMAIMLPLAALQAKIAKKQLYQLSISGSAIQIILLFLLIHFFGLWGAILAKVTSRFIGLFLSFVFLKKIGKKPIS